LDQTTGNSDRTYQQLQEPRGSQALVEAKIGQLSDERIVHGAVSQHGKMGLHEDIGAVGNTKDTVRVGLEGKVSVSEQSSK